MHQKEQQPELHPLPSVTASDCILSLSISLRLPTTTAVVVASHTAFLLWLIPESPLFVLFCSVLLLLDSHSIYGRCFPPKLLSSLHHLSYSWWTIRLSVWFFSSFPVEERHDFFFPSARLQSTSFDILFIPISLLSSDAWEMFACASSLSVCFQLHVSKSYPIFPPQTQALIDHWILHPHRLSSTCFLSSSDWKYWSYSWGKKE